MSLPDPTSRVHLADFLNVCRHFQDEGGHREAMDIYAALMGKQEYRKKLQKPDIVPFNIILSICADAKSQAEFQVVKEVWSKINALVEYGDIERSAIDEKTLSSVLRCCIFTRNIDDVKFGLPSVREWLKLPIDERQSTEFTFDSKLMSAQLFGLLMRFGNRMGRPQLSLKWYEVMYHNLSDSIKRSEYVRSSVKMTRDYLQRLKKN